MTAALTFGEWLKRRRMGLGLTQKELAHQVGYAQVTLRKVEADELRPSGQMARKLAEALELAPEEQPQFVRFARDEAHWDDLSAARPFTLTALPATQGPEPETTSDACHCHPGITHCQRTLAQPADKAQSSCPDHSAYRQRRRTCRAGAAAGRPCDAAGDNSQRRRDGQDQPGHRGGRAANQSNLPTASAGCRWRR